ncbi:hypothetical protein PanWU01x14_259500, partial [Parasponia andersonii]
QRNPIVILSLLLVWSGLDPAATSSHGAPRAPTRAYPSRLSPKFTPLNHFLIDPSTPVSFLTLETSPLVSALRASSSYSSVFFLLEQVHRRSSLWSVDSSLLIGSQFIKSRRDLLFPLFYFSLFLIAFFSSGFLAVYFFFFLFGRKESGIFLVGFRVGTQSLYLGIIPSEIFAWILGLLLGTGFGFSSFWNSLEISDSWFTGGGG